MKRRDNVIQRACNFFLRFASHEYRSTLDDVIKEGFATKNLVPGPFPRSMTKSEVDRLAKGCLFCGSQEVYEGPSGGLNTNFECDHCGAYYNLANIAPPFGCEIIHGPRKDTHE